MIVQHRHYKISPAVIDAQQTDPLTSDLYMCEIAELLVKNMAAWEQHENLKDHLLIYCTKGRAILSIANDQVPIKAEQYCIIPEGFQFKLVGESTDPSVFLVCYFNGLKSKILEKDFSAVRDLIPSINNQVANRKMLFDELFNNLSKGYTYLNNPYISFTFSHLLASFVFASKTAEDIEYEKNPVVQNAIHFLEQNLNRKLTLEEVAAEVAYSPSHFSTLFKAETNYSPLSYFAHLKIVRACEYLDQTRMKVKEIAFALGFTDPYYFSKDFQKKMGISPRAFRNRMKR